MFKTARPFFLTVETSLHAGSGSDLGIVDLPIQREKHTDFPKIEASGLKGSMKEVFRTQPNQRQLQLGWDLTVGTAAYDDAVALAFGSDRGDLQASALGFTDARLLLFPVKSVAGVFAWITCPFVLQRLQQDLQLCNIAFSYPGDPVPAVPTGSNLIVSGNHIVLEEYTFEVSQNAATAQLAAWLAAACLPADSAYDYVREKLKTDLVVLRDDDFRDFVTLSTEVIPRIKIDQSTGTVQDGAFWYEEYLPADSMLYALVLASPIFQSDEEHKGVFQLNEQEKAEAREESDKVIEFFADGLPAIMQIGGNATIGKGLVRTHIYEAEGAHDD